MPASGFTGGQRESSRYCSYPIIPKTCPFPRLDNFCAAWIYWDLLSETPPSYSNW